MSGSTSRTKGQNGEREARYWCAQPDRPTPGVIPARKGHGCPDWTARASTRSDPS